MTKVIPATQAKNRFGVLIRNVFIDDEHIIVEKGGIPVIAIIPYRLYQRIKDKLFTEHKRKGGETI